MMTTQLLTPVRCLIVVISCLLFADVAYSGVAQESVGQHWVSIFPIGSDIHSLAPDPHNANILYASTYRGLFKSTDGGKLWRPVRLTSDIESSVIQIDPTSSQTLYWAWKTSDDKGYLWKSKDGGINWDDIGAGVIRQVSSITIHPKTSDIVYVISPVYVTSPDRLHKSVNGGKTWADITPEEVAEDASGMSPRPGMFPRLGISINSTRQDTIATYSNWWQCPRFSDNGGLDWYEKQYTFGKADDGSERQVVRWSWLAFHPTSEKIILAIVWFERWDGDDERLMMSQDGGASWDDISLKRAQEDDYREPEILSIALSRKNAQVILVGTNEGLYISTNAGRTWTNSFPKSVKAKYIREVEIGSDNAIYIATAYGIYKSTDEGKNWKAASFGLPARMGAEVGQMYPGEEGEETGRKELLGINEATRSIYVSDEGGYGGGGRGYWVSSDGGLSWEKRPSHEGGPLRQLVTASDGTAYFVYVEDGMFLFKVITGRDPVKLRLPSRPLSLAISPSSSTTLYAIATNEEHLVGGETADEVLLKSKDAGFSWSKVEWQRWIPRELGGDWHEITLLSVDHRSSDVLYAAVKHSTKAILSPTPRRPFSLLKTTDGGDTWADITSGLYQSIDSIWSSSKQLNPKDRPRIAQLLIHELSSLIIDPSNSNTIYLTSSVGGAYRSDDGGRTWRPLQNYLKDLVSAFDKESVLRCKGRGKCIVAVPGSPLLQGMIFVPPNTVVVDPLGTIGQAGVAFNNIAIDAMNAKVVYLATSNGIYISANRGDTWRLLDRGLLDQSMKRVVTSSSIVLAEGESGIYRLSE